MEKRSFDDIEMAREVALERRKLKAALARQRAQQQLPLPKGFDLCFRFPAMPRGASVAYRFRVAVRAFWTILRSPVAPTRHGGE